MKKVLVFLAVLFFTFALLAGCQGKKQSTEADTKKDEPIKIGVSLQGMTPFCISIKAALEQNVARYKNQGIPIDITILDGANDAAKQVGHCENFVQQGMDVIILNPISYDGCAPGVDAAVAANIPVITLITQVANQDKCVSFCGSPHYNSGVMVMENAIRDNGDSFACVIIEGVMGIDAQIQRMKGFRDVLAKYPNISVIEVQTANWERPDAMRLVENWLQAGKKFDVIISENDNMALGAIEALKAAGRTDIPVYGVDGDSDALQAIKNGEYAGTAFMSAMGQATKAIDFSVALVQGRPQDVEEFPDIPFEWVNISNVNDYLK
jgi:ABC-type sugar transport system substrate-binding protein